MTLRLLVTAATTVLVASAARPNIIVVVADDYGARIHKFPWINVDVKIPACLPPRARADSFAPNAWPAPLSNPGLNPTSSHPRCLPLAASTTPNPLPCG